MYGWGLNNGPVQEIMIIGEFSTFELLELQNTFTQAMRMALLVQSVRLWDTWADEINVSTGETEEQNNPALFETMAIRGKSVPGGLDQIRDP